MSGNLASGTVSLDDIGERLKKLETSFQQQTSKPKNLSLNFGGNTGKLQAKTGGAQTSRPAMSLNFHSSAPEASLRPSLNIQAPLRKKQISFQLPTTIPPPKSYESQKVDERLQEVIRQTGKLRIGGRLFDADVNEFENLGQIGSGTCGQVYKMKYKLNNFVVAVKQMNRSGNREEQKRILMDLDIVQKSHDCPTIVMCYGTFVTESSVWICMELMETCFDKLKKRIKGAMPENILGKLTVAVVKALNYLKEQHGVIHRDVKPSNILISRNGDIKLCDFGISGRLVDSQAKTRAAGCAAYMAPERISPDPSHPNYDIRADVWSLGISLVELATGVFPYSNCKTDFEMLTKILGEDPPILPPEKNFSIHFRKFVSSCCTKSYLNRPKYRELLQDDFVKRYEAMYVDITSWLRLVLQPPPEPPASNLFARPNTQPLAGEKSDDPFAFAAEITRAQFAKHSRTRSLGMPPDFTKKPASN